MSGKHMTLNTLQFWRKAVPFLIAIVCVSPWPLIHAGGFGSIEYEDWIIAISVALLTAFFYVALKMREPRWNRENEEYVRTQIRESLITLIPEDLDITSDERDQLASAEIYKELSGVFWDTINQTEVLRSQKEHFYSNGLEYTTVLDLFLLFRFFGVCYLCASLAIGDAGFFFVGLLLICIALFARWFAIPRVRKHHLDLSNEQLELLKREKGDYVSSRFRRIVLGWRETQRPTVAIRHLPLRPNNLALWDALTGLLILVVAFVGTLTRRWFDTNGQSKMATAVNSSYVGQGPHDEPVVVVFVHGVFGAKDASWLNSESKSSFPELLASDPNFTDQVDVFVFEYSSPEFRLAPSIVDIADQLRGALDDHQVFQKHKEVVFLAHSMGGIIVREFLLSNQDRIPKVPMIFFYATPTNGTQLAAIAKLASPNPQLRGMTPLEGNDFLQSIQSGWLNSSKAQSIASYCGMEELPTFGEIVVPRSSATSLCNRGLDPLTANHIDIVKPESRSDARYTRFASALIKEVPGVASRSTR
jgi:PGAP1-like protein